MKANEIQIGDWVFNSHHNKPIQITPYDFFTHSHKDGVQSFEGIKNPKPTLGRDLSPIPLTAEILEKNGWNDWCEHSTIARSVSVLVEDNTNLCIQEIKGQDSMFVQISHCGAGTFNFRKHLKYVHELQHALRLCGIDKEIVL